MTTITRDEFAARFKARMLARSHATPAAAREVAEYADAAVADYWGDPSMRKEEPEDCADVDMSYWDEE
ncbi:MAG TPA: hypothetical protein VNT30_09225 [Stellaceae bacterium]|nr:hypothetical protein [Stellaceae bacterium]